MRHIFFAIFLLFSGSVLAVNPVALWMPVSLQDLMPQLMQAAEMAEATERCDKVMSGRHSSKRSTTERPVFSIICRDAQTKRTYSILYAVENGQIVEFNEQQRASADGQPAARPWENPALKPVQNSAAIQPVPAAVTATAPITTAAPVPAAPVAAAPAPVATNTVRSSPLPSPAAAPQAVAPTVQSPLAESAVIDPRLAKRIARLEAAGVKGASAKLMLRDLQNKALEDGLSESEQADKPVANAAPTVASVAPDSASPNAIAGVAASGVGSEGGLPVAADAKATAVNAATPPVSIVESVSKAIAEQLWAQCLPALKEKTASMIDRVLDEKTIPSGYPADAGATRMDVPFEAKNPEGMNLRFTAVCTVDAIGRATVKLRPRRD